MLIVGELLQRFRVCLVLLLQSKVLQTEFFQLLPEPLQFCIGLALRLLLEGQNLSLRCLKLLLSSEQLFPERYHIRGGIHLIHGDLSLQLLEHLPNGSRESDTSFSDCPGRALRSGAAFRPRFFRGPWYAKQPQSPCLRSFRGVSNSSSSVAELRLSLLIRFSTYSS